MGERPEQPLALGQSLGQVYGQQGPALNQVRDQGQPMGLGLAQPMGQVPGQPMGLGQQLGPVRGEHPAQGLAPQLGQGPGQPMGQGFGERLQKGFQGLDGLWGCAKHCTQGKTLPTIVLAVLSAPGPKPLVVN